MSSSSVRAGAGAFGGWLSDDKRLIAFLTAQHQPIPDDDEPFTDEDREAVENARKGRFISHAALKPVMRSQFGKNA